MRDAAQRLVDVAPDRLQRRLALRRGAVHALEAEREAGVFQLEQVVVRARVLHRLLEVVEEPRAADALAEIAAQHRVLRPDVPVVAGQVLHDVVGRRAERVLRRLELLGIGAGIGRGLLEALDGAADRRLEVGELRLRHGVAQPPQQIQQRTCGDDQRVRARRPDGLDRAAGRRLHGLAAGRGAWLRRRGGAAGAAGLGRHRAAARLRPDDGAFVLAEGIERVVAHFTSSLTAQNSSLRSGQSPEKCMPTAGAWLNSAQSGVCLSRRK